MSLAKEFAAAGPGCAAANGLLNCFETTKVKLQLLHKVQPSSSCSSAVSSSSSSVLHRARPIYHTPTMQGVMSQIAKEEGIVRGLLTPGLSASLTRSMLYGAYRVGLYSYIRDALSDVGTNGTNNRTNQRGDIIIHRILSGMVCGGLGSMISCPLDVIRTRLQADSGVIHNGQYTTGLRRGKCVRYTGMISALLSIWKTEGIQHGLYRGASVTVARASVLNGAQLASYDTMKKSIKKSDKEEGLILHFTCGLASGIIAQTVVMPIDTIKSQMMLGHGWSDVLGIVQRNGLPWLYRGITPACAGQGLIMVLQMPLIEQFRKLLGVGAI